MALPYSRSFDPMRVADTINCTRQGIPSMRTTTLSFAYHPKEPYLAPLLGLKSRIGAMACTFWSPIWRLTIRGAAFSLNCSRVTGHFGSVDFDLLGLGITVTPLFLPAHPRRGW